MSAERRRELRQLIQLLAIIVVMAFVGLVTAEVRPATGVRTHYGFQARGPIFLDSTYAHMVVDVDLQPFGALIMQAEEMLSIYANHLAGSPMDTDLLETWFILEGRVKWMNITYNQLRAFYTDAEGEDVEARMKRFIFTALLAGAIGGLTGSGIYGYVTGGQTAQLREDFNNLQYRLDKLVHVAELADHNIQILDGDVARLKSMANRLAEHVVKNRVGLNWLELTTKVSTVIDVAADKLAVIRTVTAAASANRVSSELLPYAEAKKEFAKLQRMVEMKSRKLATQDARKLVTMEATILPGKGNKFAIMTHVPTFKDELVMQVYKYNSYAVYDENSHVNIRVKGSHTYLAVSEDKKFFTELSADQLAGCHIIGQWRNCPDVKSVREDYNSSCLMMLFMGHQKEALKLCQLHIEPVVINVDAVGRNTFRVSNSRAADNMRINFRCEGNETMASVQMLTETYVELRPGCVGIAGPVKFYSEAPEIESHAQNLHWVWTLPLANVSFLAEAMSIRNGLQLKEEWKDRVLPSSAETLVGLKEDVHWTVWPLFITTCGCTLAILGLCGMAGFLHLRPPTPQPANNN